MASKYLQKFPVPENFPEILHDFAREILRDQPEDILDYGNEYFKAKDEGLDFDYPKKGTNIPPVASRKIDSSAPPPAKLEALKQAEQKSAAEVQQPEKPKEEVAPAQPVKAAEPAAKPEVSIHFHIFKILISKISIFHLKTC
jgi:hypothetical protein